MFRTFQELLDALPVADQDLTATARLVIRPEPSPFVPPTVAIADGDGLGVEVLLLAAPAAVGKSTLAAALSSDRHLPLLDLSVVPVSTHSLTGLLQAEFAGTDAPAAFHRGLMPIVVDALDEGRLLSDDRNFEGFLETVWELIASDRTVADRPKVIMLGRPETIAFVELSLDISGHDISRTCVTIDFFDEAAARNLVDAFADALADDEAAFRHHPGPVAQVVDAYFDAIAEALNVERAELWQSPEGAAFAGYAPVLAALGSLLATAENFVDLINRLRSSGASEAWDVIGTVAREILVRERTKVVRPFEQQTGREAPAEVYDDEEQLRLLSYMISGTTPPPATRLGLAGGDLALYERLVQQFLPEHAFLRNGQLSNAVLGSLVLTYGIVNDCVTTRSALFRSHARLPFLWRTFSGQLGDDDVVDGRFVGYILSSLLSDPWAADISTAVASADRDGFDVAVTVSTSTAEHGFGAVSPVMLYGEVRDTECDLDGELSLLGHAVDGSGTSTFYVRGGTRLAAHHLVVDTNRVTVEGDAWISADEVTAPDRLELRVLDDARHGWGGRLADIYPWNRFPGTLDASDDDRADALAQFLDEAASRLTPAAPITLTAGGEITEDERTRWIARKYAAVFAALIDEATGTGFVSAETMPSAGPPKRRVRFHFTWLDLLEADRGGAPAANAELVALLRGVRERLA